MEMATHESSRAPAKKRNERMCAGCGKHALAEELVRVVHDPSSGEIAVDLAASGFGRGAHVHASPECVSKALKGGFSRVFKTKVAADLHALVESIVSAADRRLEGLLTGARRAGHLAVGSDVVADALQAGRAELVVVARDAAAATKLPEIQRAISAGKAIAFADKQRMGVLLARDEVAVVAVLHPGVAAAIAQTYRMSGSFRDPATSWGRDERGAPGSTSPASQARRESEEAWSSSEVR